MASSEVNEVGEEMISHIRTENNNIRANTEYVRIGSPERQ